MGKFEGILICTDLDGTLLNSGKEISAGNRAAIEYFKAEGGLFTFVTGRMPSTSVYIYETIQPNAPFGCINGGGLYDYRRQEFLWAAELPREALELVDSVDRELPGIGIQVNTTQAIYFNKYNPAMVRFREVTGLPDIRCHYREVQEPLAKVVFGEDDEETLFALMRLLHEHPKAGRFDFIRSERNLYEILPKGISKGTAVQKLTELLGLDPAKTIAIGDYDNDVAMIRTAGLGCAVANASAAAKEAADYITVSNDEDAIAVLIEALDRGAIILGR